MSIVVDNLHFAYGRVEALRGINVRAEPGQVTAVMGPNASGKSTLLKCIMGALRPGTGQVLVDGKSVHSFAARQLAERIAYVPQRSTVSAAFTVRQVVELGRYALPPSSMIVEQAIRRLDLTDIADRPYPRLSVGQQQRVTLARAVAQLGPRGCLVLDEPTSAMDLHHMAACIALLREMAHASATVIVAMHDFSLATALADHIWLLDGGSAVASGPMRDVLSLDRLRAVFRTEFTWVQPQQGPARLFAQLHATGGGSSTTIPSP